MNNWIGPTVKHLWNYAMHELHNFLGFSIHTTARDESNHVLKSTEMQGLVISKVCWESNTLALHSLHYWEEWIWSPFWAPNQVAIGKVPYNFCLTIHPWKLVTMAPEAHQALVLPEVPKLPNFQLMKVRMTTMANLFQGFFNKSLDECVAAGNDFCNLDPSALARRRFENLWRFSFGAGIYDSIHVVFKAQTTCCCCSGLTETVSYTGFNPVWPDWATFEIFLRHKFSQNWHFGLLSTKNCSFHLLGYLWWNLGSFLFQHLVTLVQSHVMITIFSIIKEEKKDRNLKKNTDWSCFWIGRFYFLWWYESLDHLMPQVCVKSAAWPDGFYSFHYLSIYNLKNCPI